MAYDQILKIFQSLKFPKKLKLKKEHDLRKPGKIAHFLVFLFLLFISIKITKIDFLFLTNLFVPTKVIISFAYVYYFCFSLKKYNILRKVKIKHAVDYLVSIQNILSF